MMESVRFVLLLTQFLRYELLNCSLHFPMNFHHLFRSRSFIFFLSFLFVFFRIWWKPFIEQWGWGQGEGWWVRSTWLVVPHFFPRLFFFWFFIRLMCRLDFQSGFWFCVGMVSFVSTVWFLCVASPRLPESVAMVFAYSWVMRSLLHNFLVVDGFRLFGYFGDFTMNSYVCMLFVGLLLHLPICFTWSKFGCGC